MPDIQILSPHLADLIAAGEVVERPASVVKELVENAFDAGARTVTVELRGGGATYLRVTDDGCGMAPEDAGIAFLRHATSKLHDEQGLEAIGTMGFRGEALAAISAVSHITLTTRQRGTASGTHMTLDAGDIQDMYETGCPEGTTMIVRDLFFNTPARRKFLKSDRAEGAACAAAALRCALGRPDVSVRCIRDGEEVFFSPGDNKLDSCVYSLLGRDLAMSLLPCEGEADGARVHGFISSPAAGRGSRAQQYFFCNGRWIRSAALQAALEQAYRNTLLVGRFPACVLYVELSCAAVDVNVHPAKTEVKFTHERAVFDAVYYGARAALEAGATELGVAAIEEALQLRAAGITAPLLCWLYPPGDDFAAAIAADVQLSASIGATFADDPQVTVADLLRVAEAAMMQDRVRGQGQVNLLRGRARSTGTDTDQLTLEEQLRDAIDRDDLGVHYQPIVGNDGTVRLAEALLRWEHPDLGRLSADVVLDVAERGGLLADLDRCVLRTALRESAGWRRPDGGTVGVAVNLAGLRPEQHDFVEVVTEAIREAGTTPDRVVLEMVETVLAEMSPAPRQAMTRLSETGVRFAVDDFGTGYSSLARLRELPAEIVKLDRDFISGVGSDPADLGIVLAMSELVRTLGRFCIAEGVETSTQHHLLRAVGIDAYQGYLFTAPLPPEEFRAFLRG